MHPARAIAVLNLTMMALLLTTGAWAQVDLRHRLDLEWALETDSPEEDQKLELVYQPTFEATSETCTFLTQVRLRGDVYDDLEPGVPSDDTYSTLSKRYFIGTQADAELRELWLRCGGTHFFVTLGKQQIVWGKADGLKVLDVVNPQSFREFILDEFEDSRIPLWTVNTELTFGSTNLQLVYVPDTTYHELPEAGATFYLTSPLFYPDFSSSSQIEVRPLVKPDDDFSDADYGARLSTFAGGWDLSFIYFRHIDDTPVFRTEVDSSLPAGRTIFTPTYVESDLYGFSFSNAFGDLTLRGEVGYTPDKAFTINGPPGPTFDPSLVSQGLVESDDLSYVLGLDWYGITNALISVQAFESRLGDDDLPVLRPEVDTNLTALVRWWNQTERLQLELIWLHGVEYDDGLVRPKIRYAWNDTGQVFLGYDLFYGDPIGQFGQFDDRDRLRLGLRFDF